MSMPSWALPAGLAAAVVGGLAFLGIQNKRPRLGDVVAVSPRQPVPGLPANAYGALQISQINPVGTTAKYRGLIIGSIDGATGLVTLLPAALPGFIDVAPPDINGLWRLTNSVYTKIG